MSFTNHFPDAAKMPVITVDPADNDGEAVFVTVHADGTIQIVELTLVREWADGIYRGEIDQADAFWELYVRLPGGKSLLPCVITFAGTHDEPKMVITGTASVSGVLLTTDL